MKKNSILFLTLSFTVLSNLNAQTTLPKPDHVVFVLLENYNYSGIIDTAGNAPNDPYINSLYNDPTTATFTGSYAISHPSLPNYLDLYAGNAYGVTTDNIPTNTPWSYCNLGASVISAGYTWGAYSESMPSVGYTGSSSGNYAEKHCPWVIFQGTGTNQVPASTNMPFTMFPDSLHYNTLPTVSWVIPNMVDDMHDPSYNAAVAISNGDTWLKNNLGSLIRWCKANNSLLILTFDEDDGIIVAGFQTGNNRIATMFIGGMVNGGHYPERIDHYSVLRTVEDMYGLPRCGNSATATTITDVWKPQVGIAQNKNINNTVSLYPIPASEKLSVHVMADNEEKITLTITDLSGKTVKQEEVNITSGNNTFETDIKNMADGFYLLKLSGSYINHTEKFVISK